MQEFNIELPKEVLTPGKHHAINFDLLEGKVIVGLMGYAKSGKDFIARTLIEEYGYQRIAFADNIKKEMNLYLKEAIYNDIKNIYEDISKNNNTLLGKALFGKPSPFPFALENIDFFTEDLELKKILRPYIIWYGETLRNINGRFCWINRVFAEDAKEMDRIVLSDVRRMAELDVFRNSNEFNKRKISALVDAGVPTSLHTQVNVNNYGTLLFEVNQFGLTDSDALTIETIQAAREQWLIDDTFYVDSRIPAEGPYRNRAMENQIKKMVKKFGIEKPDKVKYKQTTIFQSPVVDGN